MRTKSLRIFLVLIIAISAIGVALPVEARYYRRPQRPQPSVEGTLDVSRQGPSVLVKVSGEVNNPRTSRAYVYIYANGRRVSRMQVSARHHFTITRRIYSRNPTSIRVVISTPYARPLILTEQVQAYCR